MQTLFNRCSRSILHWKISQFKHIPAIFCASLVLLDLAKYVYCLASTCSLFCSFCFSRVLSCKQSQEKSPTSKVNSNFMDHYASFHKNLVSINIHHSLFILNDHCLFQGSIHRPSETISFSVKSSITSFSSVSSVLLLSIRFVRLYSLLSILYHLYSGFRAATFRC